MPTARELVCGPDLEASGALNSHGFSTIAPWYEEVRLFGSA